MAACSSAITGQGIITNVLSSVDSVGCSYVQSAYQGLSQSLTAGGGTGVAGLMLTLYVIFWGYGIWSGTASGGPTEYAWRLLRVFVIYTLATQWGDFQTLVYTLLNDGPSAIGSSLLAAATANNTGSVQNLGTVSGVENALQNVWDTSVTLATNIINSFSVLNFGGYVIAMLLLAIMAVFIGYAAFLIVLSKLFMWLLLSLAPIFILLLLFGFSSRFFSGWASALAQYVIVQVLVFAFLAFYVAITQQTFNAVQQTGIGAATMNVIAPVLIVGIIGILLVSQIPVVAAAIAGSISMQAPSFGYYTSGLAGVALAPARGIRGAVNSFRNPLNPSSISRAERLAGQRQVRTSIGALRSPAMPEAERLRNQLRDRV